MVTRRFGRSFKDGFGNTMARRCSSAGKRASLRLLGASGTTRRFLVFLGFGVAVQWRDENEATVPLHRHRLYAKHVAFAVPELPGRPDRCHVLAIRFLSGADDECGPDTTQGPFVASLGVETWLGAPPGTGVADAATTARGAGGVAPTLQRAGLQLEHRGRNESHGEQTVKLRQGATASFVDVVVCSSRRS